VILDGENRPVDVMSLLAQDLADPEVYATMKSLILAAMGE
jgi:hypothetical protein